VVSVRNGEGRKEGNKQKEVELGERRSFGAIELVSGYQLISIKADLKSTSVTNKARRRQEYLMS
jgi:hypothetical protein